MLRGFTFVLALTFQSVLLIAQTLGERSIPTPGTAYIELSCDTTGVAPGEAGSDRTWNFRDLFVNSEPRTITYQAADLLPQTIRSAYPNATVFHQTDTELFVYGRLNDEYQLFVATVDGSGRYYDTSSPLVVRHVPTVYGAEYTSPFRSKTMSGIDAPFSNGSGTASVSLDGKGVLSLPIVGDRPAYRIHSLIISSDTLTNISGLPEGTRLNEQVDSYQYFDAEDESLLLDITRATLSAVTKNGVPLGPTQFRSSVRLFRTITNSINDDDFIQSRITMIVEPGSRIPLSRVYSSPVQLRLIDVVGRVTNTTVDYSTSRAEFVVPDLIEGFYIVLAGSEVVANIVVRSK